jgi:hypothetical protein
MKYYLSAGQKLMTHIRGVLYCDGQVGVDWVLLPEVLYVHSFRVDERKPGFEAGVETAEA